MANIWGAYQCDHMIFPQILRFFVRLFTRVKGWMHLDGIGCSSNNKLWKDAVDLVSQRVKISKNDVHQMGMSDHQYITCKHEKIAILIFEFLMIGLYLGNHKADQSGQAPQKKVLLMRKI